MRKDLVLSILAGLFLALGWCLQHFVESTPIAYRIILFVVSYILGGFMLSIDLSKNILKGKIDIDLLMMLAAIGAAVLGRWAEGSLLLFLFSMGHSLEHLALDKANNSIAALAKLKPTKALVRQEEEIIEIPIERLKVGDCVIVRPDSNITADGIVIKGHSNVDQSSITGESLPVEKFGIDASWKEGESVPEEHRVFSGTQNGQGYLELIVTRDPSETTLARLIRMVEGAKENKSYAQEFTHRFERYFVPAVLSFVALLLLAFLFLNEPFSSSFYRAMTVLVVASPCALVISTPSAVLCGIARAARMGVLIKGGKPLVDFGSLDTLVFDKTGTLTLGKPMVTDVIPISENMLEEFAPQIIALEEKSNHPLAKAIVGHFRSKYTIEEVPEVTGFRSLTGCGIKGIINGEEWSVGNTELFIGLEKQHIAQRIFMRMSALEKEGKTTVFVGKQNQLIGLLGIMDLPRKENIAMIQSLRSLGVKNILLLSGDRQLVAEAVGRELGIDQSNGELLPEDKMQIVKDLVAQYKRVAMVGDGVNDAPAMASSTVSVAMGAAGNDVALETADIALMSEKLEHLPRTMQLSRKTRSIIRQNIFISLGVIVVMIPIAILSLTSIGPAVIIHEGSTLAVVLNALRILK